MPLASWLYGYIGLYKVSMWEFQKIEDRPVNHPILIAGSFYLYCMINSYPNHQGHFIIKASVNQPHTENLESLALVNLSNPA